MVRFTEELLGVFQEASLVAEANNYLKELVDLLDDSNIEYEDQQLFDDNDTDSNDDEFGAAFVQSLQNE
nr:3445_t:CDS:2 [Entrophospora candida]